MKVHLVAWVVFGVYASVCTGQFPSLFRQGRLFNFGAWSGRQGPFLKRHPIPIRLYRVYPQQFPQYVLTQQSEAQPATVPQSEPVRSSYQTVPYVCPPNDFEAVKSLKLNSDPFLRGTLPVNSGIHTLPLERPSHVASNDGNSFKNLGLGTRNQVTQTQPLASAILPPALALSVVKDSIVAHQAVPVQQNTFVPAVAVPKDGSVVESVIPVDMYGVSSSIAVESGTEETVDAGTGSEEVITEGSIQIETGIDEESGVTTIVPPGDEATPSSSDSASQSHFQVFTPQITDYMTIRVPNISPGIVEENKQQVIPVFRVGTFDFSTSEDKVTKLSASTSTTQQEKKSPEENRNEDITTAIDEGPISLTRNVSNNHLSQGDITVIRKIYPSNFTSNGPKLNATEVNRVQFNIAALVSSNNKFKQTEEVIETKSTPSFLGEVTKEKEQVKDTSIIQPEENLESSSSSFSESLDDLKILPEPPRPLLTPIASRTSPTFLIQRLKEKFPHKAVKGDFVLPVETAEILSQGEDVVLPLQEALPDNVAVIEIPDLPALFIRPNNEEKEVEKEKLLVFSGGIGQLPLEELTETKASAQVVVPTPEKSPSTEEPGRGYRFSYSVEDDHSGSSYSRL
ncbi:uncharacterized protein LOC108672706 isoform X3 [Hyalella azteca]|uniref:Uncharacterized protein LOC108672706 isoform X3 n=1 Tax=Hyalella azteca TaxID=294128 RepID=A0A8B7NQC5_HYAAZ|nr:uncharacterized protein LOC108672706 isoform X3 [Hyalella azteca]